MNSAQPLPPNTCIFCGWVGKLTGEHIHSQWLHDELKQYVRGYRIEGTSRLVRGERGAEIGRVYRRREGETTLSLQLSGTCPSCNNGWMNIELEQRVAPILTRLVRGVPTKLDPAQVQKLVEWVTLKFMVVDSVGHPFFTQQDREAFFKNRTLPTCIDGVWAAPLSIGSWSTQWERWGGTNFASFTFGVGRVLFYVVGTREVGIKFDDRVFGGGRLQRIWPGGTLNAWLPVRFFTDEEAEALNQGLDTFRRQHDIQIVGSTTIHKLRVKRPPLPTASIKLLYEKDPVTGPATFFFGDEFESHACGECSYMLLHSLSIETFRDVFSPSELPVYLICPSCDAANVVPVRGAKKKTKRAGAR